MEKSLVMGIVHFSRAWVLGALIFCTLKSSVCFWIIIGKLLIAGFGPHDTLARGLDLVARYEVFNATECSCVRSLLDRIIWKASCSSLLNHSRY